MPTESLLEKNISNRVSITPKKYREPLPEMNVPVQEMRLRNSNSVDRMQERQPTDM